MRHALHAEVSLNLNSHDLFEQLNKVHAANTADETDQTGSKETLQTGAQLECLMGTQA